MEDVFDGETQEAAIVPRRTSMPSKHQNLRRDDFGSLADIILKEAPNIEPRNRLLTIVFSDFVYLYYAHIKRIVNES